MEARTPYATAARELLRNSLFDAALEQLRLRTWQGITMGDIASAAGVSRQTMYKEFGSRNEFALELVIREVRRFLDPVDAAVTANLDDPDKAVSEAFGAFLEVAAAHPLMPAVMNDEGNDELLRLFTTHGGPVLSYATDRITGIIIGGWPRVHRRDALLLAEAVVRLAVSVAALPEGPVGLTAADVATLFSPYIQKILDEAYPEGR